MKKSTLVVFTTCLCAFSTLFAVEPDQPGNTEPTTSAEAGALVKKTPGFKNLQLIGLMFHEYHDLFNQFPAAVLYGPDGKAPYSWRVELLPILKSHEDKAWGARKLREGMPRDYYQNLIAECGYDVSEAWDSPKNLSALKWIPALYRHPSDKEDTANAGFYAIVGRGAAFDPDSVAKYTDIKTWPASTLMVAEFRSNEPWTKPVDIAYSSSALVPRFGGFTNTGALVLSCDGAVHFLGNSIPPDSVRAFITRDTIDKFNIPGIPHKYE